MLNKPNKNNNKKQGEKQTFKIELMKCSGMKDNVNRNQTRSMHTWIAKLNLPCFLNNSTETCGP
jgi:hypothetical protein